MTDVLNAVFRGGSAKSLDRRVVVDDPELGAVTVRWYLGRPEPWRCGECGRQVEATCPHTFAAALVLAEHLLGLRRVPALQPNERRTA